MVTDRSDWSTEDREQLLYRLYLHKTDFSPSDRAKLSLINDYYFVHDEITDGYLEDLIKLRNKIVSK